ncbi:MAG: hypothetical protein JNJ88_14775 [Planctomycetes bacterium]|nr:hypothetical protein [Planctomycetota bacterium]
MSFLRCLSAALLATATAAAPALAQCNPNDGLSLPGACCVSVVPVLPAFPPINLQGQGNCITNCAPGAPWNVNIQISPPGQVFCDIFVMNISIAGPTPVNGLLIAKYARTWIEPGTTGVTRQVWRFLVSGDLNYTVPATGTSPCPFPKSAFAGNSVHFTGSIDYALDCGTVNFRSAVQLTHLCAQYEHASWSPKPFGTPINPDTVYAFVGPLPFVWGGGAPPAGALIADSERSTRYNLTVSPLQWDCLNEEQVVNGNLATVAPYCPCSSGPMGPAMWWQQNLTFSYACGPAINGTYTGISVPPLEPTGLSANPLGNWALGPAAFPNTRRLWVEFGFAVSPDNCTNNLPFHVVTGVMTQGPAGTVIDPFGIAQTSTIFLDLQNTLVLVGGPPFVAIGFGGASLASQTWALNL